MVWGKVLLGTLTIITWITFLYWFLYPCRLGDTSVATPVLPTVRHPRNYSSASCVGTTYTRGKEWMYRSCYFQNVCYDGNNKSQLIFFVDPLDDWSHPSELSVGSMVPYGKDGRAPVREQAVIFRGDTQIPPDAVWPHGEEQVITSLMNWFIPSVWSHLLMDNIYPIYRLLDIFLLNTSLEVEPLIMENPCPSAEECGTTSKFYRPQFTELLSPKHRWPLLPLSEKYEDEELVCFEHVVVGPSLFTDHMFGASGHGRIHGSPDWTNWGIGGTMSRFREFIVRRAGVDPYAPRLYDVVFLSKGKLAWIKNHIDLSPIVRKFNKTSGELRVLSGVRMENMTLSDQIELAVRSKVIVAQEGSTSFGALWMQPGSTLIIVGTQGLDAFLWNNLSHLRVRYFLPRQVDGIIRSIRAGLTRSETKGGSDGTQKF